MKVETLWHQKTKRLANQSGLILFGHVVSTPSMPLMSWTSALGWCSNTSCRGDQAIWSNAATSAERWSGFDLHRFCPAFGILEGGEMRYVPTKTHGKGWEEQMTMLNDRRKLLLSSLGREGVSVVQWTTELQSPFGEEYPIRCAERIELIESLPNWSKISELREVHSRHWMLGLLWTIRE